MKLLTSKMSSKTLLIHVVPGVNLGTGIAGSTPGTGKCCMVVLLVLVMLVVLLALVMLVVLLVLLIPVVHLVLVACTV
jgi:hypothetical protein